MYVEISYVCNSYVFLTRYLTARSFIISIRCLKLVKFEIVENVELGRV